MKTISNTKKMVAGLVLAMGGLSAGTASASMIESWDWISDGGFQIGGATCDNGAEAACSLQYDNTSVETPSGIAGTASMMTWGTGSGGGAQSGLQGVFGGSMAPDNGPFDAQALDSGSVPIPMFEQIMTNGGWTNTGAAVHYNNVITELGGHMTSAVLTTSFQLLSPNVGPLNVANLNIDFNETLNSGSCTSGNPHGTVCDDVFTLTGNLAPVSFEVDGRLYTASFRLADGPGAIVQGDTIYTAEMNPGTAVMYVQGRIDTIPLPGVLALMGMGLVMIGWQVRGRGRRKLV